MKNTVEVLEKKAYSYRKCFLELFTRIGFGHVTSAFSWAEIATVLYNEIMVLPKDVEKTENFDKLVVSKGHGVGILFPVFQDLGYFTPEEMVNTIKIGGNNRKIRKLYYPGFDFYGGSLGIGIGVAVGLAKAEQLNGNGNMTFCILGDAESYEGATWEAAFFAGHHRLDNLVVILDRNELGCSDFTEHMLTLEPVGDKWRSFNWDVVTVNGHDIKSIYEALFGAINNKNGKPKCIIAKTQKGHGLDYLLNKPLMHGYMPKGADIQKAFEELK